MYDPILFPGLESFVIRNMQLAHLCVIKISKGPKPLENYISEYFAFIKTVSALTRLC